jgi:hypothetical protein
MTIRSILALILTLGLVAGAAQAKPKDDDDDDKPAQAQPASLSEPVEGPALTVETASQQAGGIEVSVVPITSFVAQARHGYGSVLDPARLIELGAQINQAKAQLQAAEAKAGVARSASERANSLFREDQNISAAQRQSAEAGYRGEQAQLTSASIALKAAVATARQEFGPALGQALLDGSPLIGKLIERETMLIQVTVSGDPMLTSPPKTATIQIGQAKIEAAYLSPAARLDPRLQGTSLLFTAPSQGGLLQPGLSVEATLGASSGGQGALVPESAVVRWQGKAWIYRRTGAESFVRHQISTDIPLPTGGYFVADLPPKPEIVTRGAQLLLSQEFRSKNAAEDD